jgi:hypothetical protein
MHLRVNYPAYQAEEEQTSFQPWQVAIDLYVDGEYWSSLIPKRKGDVEADLFQGVTRKLRQFNIYLPIYHALFIPEIFIDNDAAILPPAPFVMDRPLVFYGTSITQGGCASRSGLSYPARLCRELNMDFVNLGFSAAGRGELKVAQAVAEIDAACYVLDYGQNNESARDLEKVYAPFIREIRKVRPLTPILLTALIRYASEKWDAAYSQKQEDKRNVIRKACREQIALGDQNIYLVEGNELISLKDSDAQGDGCHPNDEGFLRMSQYLKDIISKIIGISA